MVAQHSLAHIEYCVFDRQQQVLQQILSLEKRLFKKQDSWKGKKYSELDFTSALLMTYDLW